MVAPELKQNADADTEITKTCAVLGCDDSKNLGNEEFFRFPEDSNYRQIWADLTGRNNWTPTDFSYICIQHFSVDSFTCTDNDEVILLDKAVPSLKLPRHVLEVEYIDEDTLENEEDEDMDGEMDGEMDEEMDEEMGREMDREIYKGMDGETDWEDEKDTKEVSKKRNVNGNTHINIKNLPSTSKPINNIEVLKLFTEVQMMQRQAVGLKEKLKYNMKIHNRQSRFLNRLKQIIEMKKDILNQKRKKKARILLSVQDKIKEDGNGLVMAMPTRHTDDLKNFALSIYKYSPQAYIYTRNTLRTLLPSTDVLETWVNSGYQPTNVMTSSSLIKVTADQTDTELSCKISLR